MQKEGGGGGGGLPLYTYMYWYCLTICPSLCFAACALSSLSIRCIFANCLLLNLLCCALESTTFRWTFLRSLGSSSATSVPLQNENIKGSHIPVLLSCGCAWQCIIFELTLRESAETRNDINFLQKLPKM